MEKEIEHSGHIKEINGNDIKVSFYAQEACSSCNLKSNCSVSDTKEKIVDVKTFKPEDYKVGESVIVFFKQSLGFKALFLGYVLPFLILLTTMIVSLELTGKELFSGLLSLAILAPYYLTLYLSKNKIKKTFTGISFREKMPQEVLFFLRAQFII